MSRTNPTTTPWDMTVSLVSVFCVSMLQAAITQKPAIANIRCMIRVSAGMP